MAVVLWTCALVRYSPHSSELDEASIAPSHTLRVPALSEINLKNISVNNLLF